MTATFIHGNLLIDWIHPYTLPGMVILGYHIHTSIVSCSLTDSATNDGTAPEVSPYNNSCVLYQICVGAETAAGVSEEVFIIRCRTGGTVVISFDVQILINAFTEDASSFKRNTCFYV